MSYFRLSESPEQDRLLRAYSPYQGMPSPQPTRTTCLAAAMDTAASAVGGRAMHFHWPLAEAMAVEAVRGLRPEQVKMAMGDDSAFLVVAMASSNPAPDPEFAYVVLIPADRGCLGHAVAATHLVPPECVWDPWPPGRGQCRRLSSSERTRWAGAGHPVHRVSVVTRP